jgi:hypothetical protein
MPRAPKTLPAADVYFFYGTRDHQLVRLPDGAPFFDCAVVGVSRTGWPLIQVTLGLDAAGWPVVNRMVVERSPGRRAGCTSCRFTTFTDVLDDDPALKPVECPKCHKGTLVGLPWSAGPSGEIFGGPELSADALHRIPWGRFWEDVIEAVRGAAANSSRKYDPAAVASTATGNSRSRHPNTPERLAKVASIVKANPEHPIAEVSKEMFTSLRNARHLRDKAIEAGLLPRAAKEAEQ